MPDVSPLQYVTGKEYDIKPIAVTRPQGSWNELETTDFLDGELSLNEAIGEREQSYPVVLSLTREKGGKEQRIVITGDADCISNAELANGRNGMFAINFNFISETFKWLSYGEFPIDTSRPQAIDNGLRVTRKIEPWLNLFALGVIPFLLAFESRRPQARELVVIAVLSALAVAARVAIPIPNFKAIFAIIMLSGIAFGPEAGFLVGAVSAFASNFFYGQGAYTPWQMFAYGAGGMLAGFLFAKGRLPQKRWVMAAFGFLACVLFVGPLLDTCTVFLTLPIINAQTAWPLYISGFPVNISQGVCTALTMVLFGPALLEKLERVKLQYGMTEDDDGV